MFDAILEEAAELARQNVDNADYCEDSTYYANANRVECKKTKQDCRCDIQVNGAVVPCKLRRFEMAAFNYTKSNGTSLLIRSEPWSILVGVLECPERKHDLPLLSANHA